MIDNNTQFRDAKALYLAYKKSATKQSMKTNLDMLWQALQDTWEQGLKDYSLAEIGRRLEKTGGPKTQSLRNPAGAPYREIISAFAKDAQGSTKYIAKTKSTVEQALDMVSDPSARAVLRAALNDAKRLKVVNDNLHAAFKKLSVGADFARSGNTANGLTVGECLDEAVTQERGSNEYTPVTLIRPNKGSAELTAKEKLILKRSIDPSRLAQNGLKVTEGGSIEDSHGNVLFPVGFVAVVTAVIQ